MLSIGDVLQSLKYNSAKAEVFSEPSRTSKVQLFAKKVNNFQPSTTFAKSSVLDVRLSSEYTSEKSAPSSTQEIQASIYIDSIYIDSIYADSIYVDWIYIDSIYVDSIYIDSIYVDLRFK